MSEFSSVGWENDPKPQMQDVTIGSGGLGDVDEAAESSNQATAAAASTSTSHDDDDEFTNTNTNTMSEDSSRKYPEYDNIYFNCSVTKPQKEDGQSPFVSYLVTTETNSPSFQSSKVEVRRRFSDFLYLHDSLMAEFAASAIPPLPDKQRLEYLKGDRFGTEFTLRRASSLGRFLTRIGRHPILKKSKTFYAFLESNDWNSYKKHKGTRSTSSEEGVFSGLSDTFLNAFSKVQNQSKELNEVKERAEKLDQNLANIEKTFSRVVRHQGNLVTDLDEFGTQTVRLATLEPGLSVEVSEFARGINEYMQSEYLLREKVDSDYIVSLKDMDNYVSALKGLIKQREQKQLDYEALQEYLRKAKVDRNNLQSGGTNFLRSKVEDFRGVDHEQSRQERVQRLDVRIDDLEREVASAKITSESFEDYAINEVQVFERIKNSEMKDSLNSLCDYNVQFYQQVLDTFESVAESMSKDEKDKGKINDV